MRLAYPDVDREALVKGMFDKLHDLLTKGTLQEYLVNYAKQVYEVMVTEFPQYRDYFINFDEYKKLPKTSMERKRFDKFATEMDNLIKDPLQINKPVIIRVQKPAPVRAHVGETIIPPGKIYKKRTTIKKRTPAKKKTTLKKKKTTPKKRTGKREKETDIKKEESSKTSLKVCYRIVTFRKSLSKLFA